MDAINWFEIPAADFERAVTFYEGLLQTTLQRVPGANGAPLALFPHETGVGGSIEQGPDARPGADGVVIYLNARTTSVFDEALARVERLGGSIVRPKLSLDEIGHIALIMDTEGNRIGLHIPPGV